MRPIKYYFINLLKGIGESVQMLGMVIVILIGASSTLILSIVGVEVEEGLYSKILNEKEK